MTFFRVSQQGTLPQGDNWVSNFHILSSQSVTAVHTACSSAISTFWNNTFKTYVVAGTTLQQIVTTELNPSNGKNVSDQVTTSTIVGTATGSTVPQQSCVLISMRTNNASKGGRGRMYLPGPAVSNTTTSGGLSPTVAAAIDTAWTSLVTGLTTTGQVVILHGGYHKDKNGVVTYLPLTGDPVTTIAVSQVLATQRRRINKVTHTYSPFLAVG